MVYWPLILSGVLILWTVLVSPHSKYGDNWAIIPALAIYPAVLHIIIFFKSSPKGNMIAYAVVHCAALFVVLLWCLMNISKDSL
jgi:hypothetical protein